MSLKLSTPPRIMKSGRVPTMGNLNGIGGSLISRAAVLNSLDGNLAGPRTCSVRTGLVELLGLRVDGTKPAASRGRSAKARTTRGAPTAIILAEDYEPLVDRGESARRRRQRGFHKSGRVFAVCLACRFPRRAKLFRAESRPQRPFLSSQQQRIQTSRRTRSTTGRTPQTVQARRSLLAS